MIKEIMQRSIVIVVVIITNIVFHGTRRIGAFGSFQVHQTTTRVMFSLLLLLLLLLLSSSMIYYWSIPCGCCCVNAVILIFSGFQML